jgi:hypothetical protein
MFRNKSDDIENLVDFTRYSSDAHEYIKSYINTLSELDIIALKIARKDLSSSFNIVKCIGFQKWLKKKL